MVVRGLACFKNLTKLVDFSAFKVGIVRSIDYSRDT